MLQLGGLPDRRCGLVVRASALRSVGRGFDPRPVHKPGLKRMVIPVAACLALSNKVKHREWNGPFHYNVAGCAVLSKPVAPVPDLGRMLHSGSPRQTELGEGKLRI